MIQAFNQFQDNFVHVRHLGAIHTALAAQTTAVIDLSDVLRAQLVMAVSSFDHFVHELVRLGMLEILALTRPTTPTFLKFKIPLANALQALASPTSSQWLEDEIRLQHGWKSFQHSDNVADAIRIISTIALWDTIGNSIGQPAADVKQTLNLIVDRRNKIAHEADCIPGSPGSRWPITQQMVNDAIDFLEQVATAIYGSV